MPRTRSLLKGSLLAPVDLEGPVPEEMLWLQEAAFKEVTLGLLACFLFFFNPKFGF